MTDRSSPDIVERLRQFAAFGDTPDCRIMAQLALTEIERLRASLQPARPTAGCDTVQHMWDQVEKARADGTFSSVPASDAVAGDAQAATPDPAGYWRDMYTDLLKRVDAGGFNAVAATPTDYVLMPREATRAMTMAGCDSLPSCEHVFGHAGEMLRNCYRKMVEVAAVPGGVAQDERDGK